jgi:hypothetical protein
MTQRPWRRDVAASALVIFIAGAGMVATAEIRGLGDQGSGPPVAGGPPLAAPAASSLSATASSSQGEHPSPVADLTPEPGSGAQLVVKQAQPTITPEAPPSAQRTPPASTRPGARAPGPSPSPTPSTAPAPTPTTTRVLTTTCVINLLRIKVCLGGN